MKSKLLTVVLVLTSTHSNAKPIYLDCGETPNGKYSIKIDEDTGKITQTIGDNAINANGFFSPDTISYKEPIPTSVGLSEFVEDFATKTIDRETLILQSGTRFKTLDGWKTSHQEPVQCKIEKIKKKNKI
jgi:hypothetical protein